MKIKNKMDIKGLKNKNKFLSPDFFLFYLFKLFFIHIYLFIYK